jgi:single-stranded DNA-binding protein
LQTLLFTPQKTFKIERSEKHQIVFWDKGNYKLAQRAAESIKKGTLIHIEGPSKTRVWEKENGEKVYFKEIHAESLIVVKQPEQQAQQQQAQQQQPKPLPNSPQQPAANPNNLVERFGSWS